MNNLAGFAFENDKIEQSTNYVVTGVEYKTINDSNNGVYGQNWVRFNSQTLMGSTNESYLDFAQATINIPLTVLLEVTSASGNFTVEGTAGGTVTAENAFAVALKGAQHLVNTCKVQINSTTLNKSSEYVNLIATEKLKQLNLDEYNLMSEIIGHSWDSAQSMEHSDTLGELNNKILPSGTFVGGIAPNSFANDGHFKRCAMTNMMSPNVGTSSLVGKVDNASQYKIHYQNSFVLNTAKRLVYQFVAVIPLSMCCDAFRDMPTIRSASNVNIELQLNAGVHNTYDINVTYAATSLTVTSAVAITSNQSVGRTCPFIVSRPSRVGTAPTGFCIGGDAAGTHTVRLSSLIGWVDDVTAITANGGRIVSQAYPCRLVVPSYSYTPDYSDSILSEPIKRVSFLDWAVDLREGVQGGSDVRYNLGNQLTRVRSLYILPFFANRYNNANPNITPALQSPFSSAGNTVSHCSLINFQIQMGGTNLFPSPLNSKAEFYQQMYLPFLGKLNGNHFKSEIFNGLIKRSDWELCYNVYRVDLQNISDSGNDDLNKQLSIMFRVDSKPAFVYDFIILTEYECFFSIDRATGQLVA